MANYLQNHYIFQKEAFRNGWHKLVKDMPTVMEAWTFNVWKENYNVLLLILFQEKTRQYEEERDKYRKEKNDWRKRSHDDLETARQDLVRMTNKVAALQDELRAKDNINHQLRYTYQVICLYLAWQIKQQNANKFSLDYEVKIRG